MKEKLRILPMKALAFFSLMLAFWPLYWICCLHFLSDVLWIRQPLPLSAMLWGAVGCIMPKKLRLPFAILGCALALASGVMIGMPSGLGGLIPFALIAGYLLLLPPAISRPVWEEWTLGIWFVGVLIHLAGQFVMGKMDPAQLPLLQGMQVLYLLLFLLMLNRQGLRDSSHGSGKAPLKMRVRNTLLLLCLFLPALLAALWGWLGDALSWLWDKIAGFLGRIIAWIARFLESDTLAFQENPGAQVMMDFGEAEQVAEQSLLSKILEIGVLVLAGLLCLILLVIVARLSYKKLKVLIVRLLERLRRYGAASGEDYVDEAESTLDLDEKAQQLRTKIKRTFTRVRQIPWEQLDGTARVRRLYQQYLLRRPKAAGMTAREALQQDEALPSREANQFAALYERARYSDHSVSCGEADAMRKSIK